jgi:hypothetical protein
MLDDIDIIDESVQSNGAVDDDMLRLSIAMYVPSDQMTLDERRSLDSSRQCPPTKDPPTLLLESHTDGH